jgi:hypothetical protein
MILFTDNSNNTLAPNITDVAAKYNQWKTTFATGDTSMDAFYEFMAQPSLERTIFLDNFTQKIEVLSPTITHVIYQ